MRIILGGALGRMGKEVANATEGTPHQIVCGVDIAYKDQPMPFPMVDNFSKVCIGADVIIDFSQPDGLQALLSLMENESLPAVLCTTGYTAEEIEDIERVSKKVALLRSANMSLGIHVMRNLVEKAAKALGSEFDIEIIEKHHRMKMDSPSGTAIMLLDAVNEGLEVECEPIFGRHGRSAKRQANEIAVHAVRGGTVTGEHEVGFYGDGEQILLTHRAENRSLFAQGAVRAATFLVGKEAGMYSMEDVVDALLA